MGKPHERLKGRIGLVEPASERTEQRDGPASMRQRLFAGKEQVAFVLARGMDDGIGNIGDESEGIEIAHHGIGADSRTHKRSEPRIRRNNVVEPMAGEKRLVEGRRSDDGADAARRSDTARRCDADASASVPLLHRNLPNLAASIDSCMTSGPFARRLASA